MSTNEPADDWCLDHGNERLCFPNDLLLGQRVAVLLEDAIDPITGVLVRRTCDGEVVVDTDDGRRYCWPTLRITLLQHVDATPNG